MPQKDEIEKMLRFDPIATSEYAFGELGDGIGKMAGLAMSVSHNEEKRQLLEENGDSTHSTHADQYMER